tara:strand:+ start:829 stop:1227 length:399 start_codon:yes stop_codon:yes gene_type:complete
MPGTMRRERFSNRKKRRNTGKRAGKRVNKRSSYKRKMTNKRKGSYKRRSQRGGSFTHFKGGIGGQGGAYTGVQTMWEQDEENKSDETKRRNRAKHAVQSKNAAKARKANREGGALKVQNKGNTKKSRWPLRK